MTADNHAITFFQTAWQAMYDGDTARLEELTHLSNFPKGTDGWLGRHWLTHAIDAANVEAVKWVLGKGAAASYLDDEGFCAIKSALEIEADAGLRADDSAMSPAQAAALVIEIVDLLVAHGADINQRLTLDETPLHAAASWSSPAVVRHLLALGANPNAQDSDYSFQTPAEIAKSVKRHEVHAILAAAQAG